jgi:hypothetical protein
MNTTKNSITKRLLKDKGVVGQLVGQSVARFMGYLLRLSQLKMLFSIKWHEEMVKVGDL